MWDVAKNLAQSIGAIQMPLDGRGSLCMAWFGLKLEANNLFLEGFAMRS